MKQLFSKFTKGGVGAVLALSTALVVTLAGNAGATCFTYNPNGQSSTSDTPVFNNFCDAPFGVGDESDFVRIRQNANGDDKDNQNNPAYTNAITSACDDGTKFDVWTYIHNDATQDLNNNGSGSAVAHDVQLAMAAPLNTPDSTFSFRSQVSASNAASVQDNATLNCNGKQVKLTLVPSSVHIYSKPFGWNDVSDAAVNGTTPLGSPTNGSGDMWACWDYRTVVVYQVTVTAQPTEKPVTATCDMFQVTPADNRKVTISQFKYTATNANVKNVVVDWGDNSDKLTVTDANDLVGKTHQYSADKTYNLNAVVTFAVENKPDVTSGGPGTACAQQVTFTPPSNHQPPTTTVSTTTPPKQLVNTGPGDVAALFGLATIAGAVAHRWMLGRRLSRQ